MAKRMASAPISTASRPRYWAAKGHWSQARPARRHEPVQRAEQPALYALADQPRKRQRDVDLEAAGLAVQRPFAEMLAVVREQPVAALAQPRARTTDHLAGAKRRFVVFDDEHRTLLREAFQRNFFDGFADDVVDESAVMHDVAIADVDAVMRKTETGGHQMGAERGFLPPRQKPGFTVGPAKDFVRQHRWTN